MALKTKRTISPYQEMEGFYQSFFLNEKNFQNLDFYSERTCKKHSEIINEALEVFFKRKAVI
ncbi:MAG TPA: hypothetical protein DHW82_02990 [Spirochaetia bacterium]|nr:MAG: hypothetical protein A2Y41_03615 [Spirochaetes bacterium GWB1_36_13]HCL55957.1 hypothetical protein [Spirochaetia bacterium]